MESEKIRNIFKSRYPDPIIEEINIPSVAGLRFFYAYDKRQLTEDPLIPIRFVLTPGGKIEESVKIWQILNEIKYSPGSEKEALTAAKMGVAAAIREVVFTGYEKTAAVKEGQSYEITLSGTAGGQKQKFVIQFKNGKCVAMKFWIRNYGEKVKYTELQKIFFPDFILVYKGQSQKMSSQYGKNFIYYDFNVSNPLEMKTVSWTAGTGDIGPTEFEIDGKKFGLELKYSEKEGQLKDNELIIIEVR